MREKVCERLAYCPRSHVETVTRSYENIPREEGLDVSWFLFVGAVTVLWWTGLRTFRFSGETSLVTWHLTLGYVGFRNVDSASHTVSYYQSSETKLTDCRESLKTAKRFS
jgi:hypothetical protein